MSSVTLSNLNAYFKQRFGNIQRILPEWAIMQDLIPFESRMQVGRSFQEPLGVTGELGFTLQGGSNLGSLQTLNDSVPFSWVESLIKPAEITGRSQISYYLLEAARSQGPAAYGRSLDELILSLDAGHRRYVETYMLYGQTSLGAVSAVTSISSTVKDATISLATWAPGLWVQLESCKVDIYQSDGTTLRNANGDVTLTQVQDPTGRKLRLTFVSSTDAGNLAPGDLIVFKGSGAASAVSANQQFAGIDAAIQNTGTLFGYDASTHNLLRGTVIDLGGVPLTMSGINTGVTAMVVRGGYGKISVVMSPYSWQDMAEDLTAQRRLGRDEKREYDVGPSRITFWGTNGAEIGLIPHPMVKTGDAFFLMPEHWLRSGASDIAYRAPGYGEDHYFLQLPTQNGVELRNYSAQFLLSRQPAKALKIKNIAPRSYPL